MNKEVSILLSKDWYELFNTIKPKNLSVSDYLRLRLQYDSSIIELQQKLNVKQILTIQNQSKCIKYWEQSWSRQSKRIQELENQIKELKRTVNSK